MLSNAWIRSIVPALLLFAPLLCMGQGVSVSVDIAPPELPVYDQPPIPGDGYLWTPGYWAWSDDTQDYYWVPGTWVEAPQPDYLWTPGYWAFGDGVYLWHAGYWGPTVGFYGGVNYGFGYGGRGYEGGYWQGGHLFYNRAVVNVGSVHITNVYNKTVVNNVTTRVSFNGGNGGVRAQATPGELAAARDRHIDATPVQRQHEQTARSNPQLRAATNHGSPPIAATPRAGNFSNPVPAQHAGTMSVVRPNNPQPRQSTPRQSEAAPDRAPVAPNRAPAAQPPAAQPPRESAPVEQRRQPEQTQPVRPAPPAPPPHAAPPPRAAPPRPAEHPEHPPEHPPEHTEEHEHH
jgi:WXXGXW repeat (2 copies)